MRVLGVVVLLAAVLAGLWWWSGSDSPARPTEAPSSGEALEAPSTAEPASALEPSDTPSSPPELTRSEVELDPVTGAEEGVAVHAGVTSRLFGRVVEASGAGLSGVEVRFYAGGTWADGVEEEEFATETDEGGHFELVVPLPTSDRVTMIIEPSRFHAFTGRDFGPGGRNDQGPLVEGDNDLGTVTLAATGAIAGSARGSNGAVPVRARVRLDGSFPGGYSIGGPVEEDGRYVIGHVPPGVYDIETIAKGFLVGKLDSIEVRANEVSQGNDLVLEPAPSIAGRVVDEEGAPIGEVLVWGWPVSSGQGAGARTDVDGRFTIFLPQDEAYSLEGGKLGYDAFGGMMTRDEWTFDPGTADVEIVLQRAVETTFAVVSAASGEPVERFGLSISQRPEERWSSSTAIDGQLVQEIPGGVVTLFAEPEEHSYRIEAPGYAPQREPVAHELPESPRQTIRLEAEGRIRGRVLFEGEPVAQAAVLVERGEFPDPEADPNEERDIFNTGMLQDLDGYVGRQRTQATDAEGLFEIGELATGTWRVELSASVGSPRAVEELRVTAGETLDLGDLELISGATVRGRVIVGVGASAPGLELFLYGSGETSRTTVTADGTFEFDGLAPGDHSLRVEDTPGIVRDMEPLAVQVTSGETKDVVLDLTPWHPCRLLVRVTAAGEPLPDATISVRAETGRRRGRIGTTNAQGELRQERVGGDEIFILVDSPGELYLGGTIEPTRIDPGGDVLIEIELSPGRLAVELPPDFELPEFGSLTLSLTGEGLPRDDQRLHFNTEAMGEPRRGWPTRQWIGGQSDLGPLAPARYQVELHVMALQWSTDHYTHDGSDPKVLRGEVEVSPGADAVCTLRVE